MPTYTYQCKEPGCEVAFDLFQWYREGKKRKCPSCGRLSLTRLIGCGSSPIMRGNPTTFGQQAEINARREGKEKMAIMAEQYKTAKEDTLKLPRGSKKQPKQIEETPWFRSGEVPGMASMKKPLDVTKVKDVKKYIMEGK